MKWWNEAGKLAIAAAVIGFIVLVLFFIWLITQIRLFD